MKAYVPLMLHTLVVLAGIVAYTVLEALGHSGTIPLGAVLAYGTGAGIQSAIPDGASAAGVPPSTAAVAPPQAVPQTTAPVA